MGDLKKYTILVVDDEEIVRNSVSFDFKRKGFTVFSAESGDEGFNIVKANKTDLVLSDIRMPNGDGLSLLEQIRTYDPAIPIVIFMTGFSQISEKECISKGAQKVILKPYDRKQLMDTIFQMLGIPAV